MKGDGGCFPRALSLNLFGNENLFAHIPLFVFASAFVSREAYFSGSGNLKVCLYVVVTAVHAQLYASTWSRKKSVHALEQVCTCSTESMHMLT